MHPPDRLESLRLLLADLHVAIDREIEAVLAELADRGLEDPVPTLSARSRREVGRGHRYTFQLAAGTYDIRAGDRAWVRATEREGAVWVTRYDRQLGVLDCEGSEWLGRRLEGAELEFGLTWLLRELAERLKEVGDEPDRHFPDTVLRTFGRLPPRLGREPAVLPSSDDLNAPQRDALERLLGSSTQLVWGPPGTGKSRLVARSALELARRGRVLVTAAWNGAVDEVAGRVASLADPAMLGADRIIRVGFDPRGVPDPRIDLRAALARRIEGGAGGVDAALAALEVRLNARRRSDVFSLGSASRPAGTFAPLDGHGQHSEAGARKQGRRGPDEGARRVSEPPNPYVRLGRLQALARSRDDAEALGTLGQIKQEIARQAERVLAKADVVLTTLSRLAYMGELRKLRYESLLLDEASTATLPYVALAASRVSGAAVAVGDFQQLAPIVQSKAPEAVRWLHTDLFRKLGVVDDARNSGLPSEGDGRCAMLDVQYRMAPEIRELVSGLFYGGRLRDAPEVMARVQAEGGRSGAERAVTLLDTTVLQPQGEQADGSRRNAAHAELVAEVLAQAARDGIEGIGVLCPYRVQARALRRLVRGRLGRAAPVGLEISTIHGFQGREKRLIVIDTVDAPPVRSRFLNERENPDFPRLLNVALSRAQYRLVIVATVGGLQRTLPSDALLNRLLARLEASGARVEVQPTGLWSAS